MEIVNVHEYRIVSALASKGYPVESKFLIYPKCWEVNLLWLFLNKK